MIEFLILRTEVAIFIVVTIVARTIYYLRVRKLPVVTGRSALLSFEICFVMWYLWMIAFAFFPNLPTIVAEYPTITGVMAEVQTAIAGILVLAATLLFVWALVSLGSCYSMGIVVRRNHTLVENGPFRYIRHPMYCSYFICFFGLIIASVSYWLLALAPLFGYAFYKTSKLEEEFLEKALGASYVDYKRRTGMFLPR